jgi:hypothetical protein
MLTYHEGDNIGSLRTVEIILHTLPVAFNPVQLPIGSTWTVILFKDETGVLILKTEDSDNGPIYNYAGSFFIHNLRDEVDQVLLPFCGKAIAILRLTDMNGRVYIIGSPDAPVTLNLAATSGQKYINENGSTFNFSVDQTSPALRA